MTQTTDEIADRFRDALSQGKNAKNAWTELQAELFADEIIVVMRIVEAIETPYAPDEKVVQEFQPFEDPIPSAKIMGWSRSEGEKMYAFYKDYRFEDSSVRVVGNAVDTRWTLRGTAPNGHELSEAMNFIYTVEEGRIVKSTRRTTVALQQEHMDTIKASGFADADDLALLPEGLQADLNTGLKADTSR